MKYATKIKYVVRSKDSGLSDIKTGKTETYGMLSSVHTEINEIKKYIDWYTDSYRSNLPENMTLEDVFIEVEVLSDEDELLDWDYIYINDNRNE